MSHMFCGCNSLISIPNISFFNTYNVNNIDKIFYECKSLISLPDISFWNIYNVKNIYNIFLWM